MFSRISIKYQLQPIVLKTVDPLLSPPCVARAWALAGSLALCAADPACAADIAFGLRHEDNLGRAEAAADRLDDSAFEFSGFADGNLRTATRSALSWEAGVAATAWTRHPDLSVLEGSLGLRWRHALDTRFGAPWIELGATAAALAHQDSALRDGARGRLGLTLGQALGARVDARVGYAHHLRRAADGAVFDTEQHEGFVQADVELAPRWLAYGGLTLREGEFTSSASVPAPKALAAANAVSRGLDRALGGRRRAYQLDATVVEAELGLNWLYRPGLALDVAAAWFDADAAGDNRYAGYRVTAGLLWRFD